jgi:hypothetical protein
MPENGQYVTRGEFNIVYDLLKDVDKKVDRLVASQAGTEAVAKEHSARRDRWAAFKTAIYATSLSSLTYIVLHFI